MLESGSLPISSAEMASTMASESRLAAMELSMARRMPVMTTVCDASLAPCACTAVGTLASSTQAAATGGELPTRPGQGLVFHAVSPFGWCAASPDHRVHGI